METNGHTDLSLCLGTQLHDVLLAGFPSECLAQAFNEMRSCTQPEPVLGAGQAMLYNTGRYRAPGWMLSTNNPYVGNWERARNQAR